MEMDKNVLSCIKEILKGNPRGMNVTEIVSEIKMNRQSVSKYLEMLVMSGHVDVRNFGPSKVYYLSQRLPVTAMLSLSYGFIIVLDRMLNVINVNDHFLEFAGVKREDMLYKSFEKFAFPVEFEPSIMPEVREALAGKESSIEAFYKKKGSESYFNVRFIPMVMDDGEKGVAIFFEDITEKKKIEKAVLDSEFKFRSIIEQTLNGIVLIDQQGRIIEFNPTLEHITGLKRDEVMGKEIWDTNLIDPYYSKDNAKLAKRKQQIQSYLKTGKSSVDRSILDRKIVRPDGTMCEVQVTLFSIKTNGGYLLCLVYNDITKGKKMERELRLSEEKFRVLVDSTDAGIIIFNELTPIEANNAAERITGYKKEDILKRQLKDVIPGDKVEELLLTINGDIKKSKTGAPGLRKNYETVIVSKSGEKHHVGFTVGVMEYMGEPRSIVTFYDITPFISLKRDLKKSEERYMLLAETAEDIIFIVGRDLKALFINPQGEKFLGLPETRIVGKGIAEFFPPEAGSRMISHLREVIETGNSISSETCIKLPDRTSWLNTRLTPIMENGAVTSVMGIARDITDRKSWEEELRKAHDDLEARVKDRTMELEVANKALIKEIDRRITLNHALMESQRTLATLISNLPGIAYRCKNDEYWTMDFISDGCSEITGYKPEDLIGNKKVSYEELVHPDDRDMIRGQIQSAIGRDEPFNITYRIVTASGKIRRVNEQGRAVFSHDGELVDIEGYISDITDLIDMKVSWDQSEEKYRTLVENISDGIWEMDKDLKFVYMSPRIYDILGFRPEDTIGKTPYDLMLAEEAKRMMEALAPLRETPKPFSFLRCFLRHKNGNRVMVDISGTPFFNERHELQGYRGITRKIVT